MVFEGDAFAGVIGHENGALMNGTSALIYRGGDLGSLSLSALCYVRRPWEDGHLQTRKQFLTRPQIWGLELGLPASRIMRRKCWCISPLVCGNIIITWADWGISLPQSRCTSLFSGWLEYLLADSQCSPSTEWSSGLPLLRLVLITTLCGKFYCPDFADEKAEI